MIPYLIVTYIIIGLFVSINFTGCFGIPHPKTKSEKMKKKLIQWGLVFMWPVFLIWVVIVQIM